MPAAEMGASKGVLTLEDAGIAPQKGGPPLPDFDLGFEPRADDCLLVIDVQVDFMPGGALAVGGATEVIPLVNALTEKFECVVLSQDWHPAGHSSFASQHEGKAPLETVAMPYGEQTLWPDHCVQGTEGCVPAQGLPDRRAKGRAPFLSPSNRTLIDRAIETGRGTRRATLEGTRGYVLPGRARARVGARAISGDTPLAIWVTFFVLETCRENRDAFFARPNPFASPTHVLRPHAYSDKPLFSSLVFVALPSPCRSGLRFTPIYAFLRAPLCAGRGTARAWILTARFTKTTTRRGRASWSF